MDCAGYYERLSVIERTRRLFLASAFIVSLFTIGLHQATADSGQLPDNKITPGDSLEVSAKDICVSGYTQKIRNVPFALKQKVYEEYGIANHAPRSFEVDHLVPLELGGSNSLRNLWPEHGAGEWNYHVKDALENKLHKLVCANKLDLKTAQDEIAKDWISAYKKYFHTDVPLSKKPKK